MTVYFLLIRLDSVSHASSSRRLGVKHDEPAVWQLSTFMLPSKQMNKEKVNELVNDPLLFGRAIAVTTVPASALFKMLKFLVEVFKSQYLLNVWMDLVDILPDVRYWSEVLCCTILTHIRDTDFEILCLSFWLKFLEVYIF